MKSNYDGKLVTLSDFINTLERRPKRTNTPKIDMDYTLIVSAPCSQKSMYELHHDTRLPFYSL